MILDKFQIDAIEHIKENHSVLVSAPTGSGKTLIAERVIEDCIHKGVKAIYTSPIKALSNQKFRDFSKLYPDKVGILTGDVSINTDAEILIMTTEIFRNKILEGQKLSEHGWIIFDEIHYMDDRERGTVWEESIMLMPPHIRLLALSATIPNVNELADWISNVHKTPIHVVVEKNRSVPLQIYYQINNKVFKNIKNLDAFRNDFRTHESEFRHHKKRFHYNRSHIMPNRVDNLLEWIETSNGLPCIYFAFSRSRCEELANSIIDKGFLSKEESSKILKYYDELLVNFNLSNERTAQMMREPISRGLAYHHAGLLPTLKEVIERLFTSRLLKVIFTTETFALGINMPARSVIFDELRKHYGEYFASLRVRDFNQMAGRAGRRGIDECGFVYLRVNPHMIGLEEIRRMVFGNPERVTSQFNSGYATILHLYEKYKEKLYDIYPSSFHFYQANPNKRSDAVELFRQKVRLLKEMSYIDESGLTNKGRFASEIYGYELPIAELYHNGHLTGLSPVALSVLIGSLIYEPRKNQDEPPLSKMAKELKFIAYENAKKIRNMEKKFRIKTFSKIPYFHISSAIEEFMRNKNFSELFKITPVDEGELVKIFRAIIQILREIHYSPIAPPELKNTCIKAIQSLNRDVIDAEKELRYN